MAELAIGSRRIRLGSGLALVALSVMLIIASPFGIFGTVTGWVLLVIMALFDLFGS